MQTLTIEQKRQRALAECMQRGISIEKQGVALRLSAPGVDFMVSDLSWVLVEDLIPTLTWRSHKRWA
jgi:hypothetical protein